MKNKLIYVFIFLLIILISSIILIKVYRIKAPQLETKTGPHLYNNPQISLKRVNLWVFYVAPKESFANNWYGSIKETLEKIKAFHYLQFKKLSNLDYQIYSRPLILDLKNISLSEENNYNILKAIKIAEEIEKQITQRKINKNFNFFPADVYNVLAIVYEGAGLYGGLISETKISFLEKNFTYKTSLSKFQGFIFISADYLMKPELKKTGPSLFYHELAHTFGIPDKYDQKQVFSLDIMGQGRFEPLENNYLEDQTLNKMGIE